MDYCWNQIIQDSFWGIGAADLNNNGKKKYLLGGIYGYDVVSLEYDGSGSVLDPSNYEEKVIYDGRILTTNIFIQT